MTETVTITPAVGWDADGEPIAGGTPKVLTPLGIAPGNTTLRYGIGGDLESAEFTVYFSLADLGKVNDDDQIEVRGKKLKARVRRWQSQRPGSRVGGLEVLCQKATGKS